MIAVRSIIASRHLQDIKGKLGLYVRRGVIGIGHDVAKLAPQLGEQHRNAAIGRETMPIVVRGIMRDRAQRKAILIDILRFPD